MIHLQHLCNDIFLLVSPSRMKPSFEKVSLAFGSDASDTEIGARLKALTSVTQLRAVTLTPTSLETSHRSCQKASWVSRDGRARLPLKDLINNDCREVIKQLVKGRQRDAANIQDFKTARSGHMRVKTLPPVTESISSHHTVCLRTFNVSHLQSN